MGYVRWDLEVAIPAESVVHSDQRVYDPPAAPNRKVLIGYAASARTMHPNSNYFLFHSQEWNSRHPDDPYMTYPYTLKVGLYSLVLGAAQKTGLYQDTVNVCGTREANMVMDCALLLLSGKGDAASLPGGALADEVTFTGLPFTEAAFSSIFSHPAKGNCSRDILDLWLKRCIRSGLESVYLVPDGLNRDRGREKNEPAEPDEAIMGLIWAVQANGDRTGLPVTYFLPEDGIIDARFLNLVAESFRADHIKIEGVLCDGSFCSLETFLLLDRVGLPYLVRLKETARGFRDMVESHGAEIRSLEHDIGDGIYGITGEDKLFCHSEFRSRLSLFYDPETGGMEEGEILRKIHQARESLEDQIRRGAGTSVPDDVRRYVKTEGTGENRTVVLDRNAIHTDIKYAGFIAIATSDPLTPGQTMAAYRCREAVEKASESLGRAWGKDVRGILTAAGAEMKFFACFIAAVFRYEIRRACRALNLETDGTMERIGDFQYHANNGSYWYADLTGQSQTALLASFGITTDMLRDFAPEITRRYIRQSADKRNTHCFHSLPWPGSPGQTNASERHSGAAGGDSSSAAEQGASAAGHRAKHPGGRPKGSKNKKTLAREAEERAKREAPGYVEPEKSKGGRPKGSRDSYQRVRSTKKQMEERRRQGRG